MRRLFILTVLLVLLAAHDVQAQDVAGEEAWYWAWIADTGEVVAYNPDGEIHVLTTDVTAVLLRPLNHQIALAMLQIGNGYALYKLESQAIIQLSQHFKGSLKDDTGPSGFTITDQHLPYVLMNASNNDPYDVWIVDTADNTLDILHWRQFARAGCSGCIRLSEDGNFLRYLASPPSDEGRELAELRERTLATNEEQVLYRIQSEPEANHNFVYCEADTFGEHWLCTYDGDENTREYWLLSNDGTIEPLLEPEQSYSYLWKVHMAGNDVFMFLEGCKVDCSLMLRSVETDDILQIPIGGEVIILGLIRADSEHLFVFTGGRHNIGILDKSGNFQSIGSNDTHTQTWSEDGRWVVVIDPNDKTGIHHQLWDVVQGQIVFEFSAGDVTRVAYRERGIIVHAPSDSFAYFYADNTGIELPQANGGFYVDILPDKNLLYERWQKKGDMELGIYHYDVATGDFTMLVLGGCSLCYDWLN